MSTAINGGDLPHQFPHRLVEALDGQGEHVDKLVAVIEDEIKAHSEHSHA